MGPTGLTAVFGMGTGVTPPVWSPEKHPAGGQTAPGAGFNGWSDHAVRTVGRMVGRPVSPPSGPPRPRTIGPRRWLGDRTDFTAIRPSWPGKGRGGRIGVVKRSAVGTGPLRRSPAVHSQPIDLVVFQEPSHIKCWKPRLEEGFALRCLQRLSFPDLATRRCPERDSRYTRGRSSPILSY
jgi:hypothetical protein